MIAVYVLMGGGTCAAAASQHGGGVFGGPWGAFTEGGSKQVLIPMGCQAKPKDFVGKVFLHKRARL